MSKGEEAEEMVVSRKRGGGREKRKERERYQTKNSFPEKDSRKFYNEEVRSIFLFSSFDFSPAPSTTRRIYT